MTTAREYVAEARVAFMDRAQWLTIERLTWALEAALAEAEARDRAVGERLARLEAARTPDGGAPVMQVAASAPAPTPSACREDCVGTCEPDGVPHSRLTCENWHKFRCDGTGPAHRPAAAATAEPERTDTPSVPPSGSVAPAVPTTGRLVAVGTCYSHPTWGDHEHEAGCINWCWSVRYGMSAAPPAPVFALTEWEREHVRIGLAAGKGSLVGTLARLAVRALAALGVPLDGEGR